MLQFYLCAHAALLWKYVWTLLDKNVATSQHVLHVVLVLLVLAEMGGGEVHAVIQWHSVLHRGWTLPYIRILSVLLLVLVAGAELVLPVLLVHVVTFPHTALLGLDSPIYWQFTSFLTRCSIGETSGVVHPITGRSLEAGLNHILVFHQFCY